MDEPGTYLRQFGLRQEPFAPTADPAFFYATRDHKECLFRLWNSIDARHGIAVVLGNYGTGKTTLLRKVLANMAAAPEHYITAVIGAPIPSWTSFTLLEGILAQFGLSPTEASFVNYIDTLYAFLLKNRGKVCTLIIDDAQNLNRRGQLELLRLVQNLETAQHKLLNLVLFAQLEWSEVLKAAPNFEQRINMTYTLRPLQPEETRELIEFRMRQAGARDAAGSLFTDSAVRAIHAYAEGSPRVTVTLCRNVLLMAGQAQAREINHELVIQTIEQTTVVDVEKRSRVAEALLDVPLSPGPQEYAEEAADDAPLPQLPRDRQSREHRAAEMLLRGMKGPGGGGG